MMDRRTEQLLSRYLDGVETPEEFAQLEQQALQDPALRRELMRLATLDTMSRTLLKETAAAREFAAPEGQVIATVPSLWQSRWFWSTAAAAAALVACVGGLNLWQARQAEKLVVATLVEARGKCSVFSGQVSGRPASGVRSPTTLRPGTRLSLGPDGYAKLAYADGTLVELQQNTAMTLGAGRGSRLFGLVNEWRGKRIQLDTGTLTARVAKQKIGESMALTTPHATATVLGTMLQLAVTTNSSLLSVQTGQVAFATATHQEIVSAGESARVQDGVLRKLVDPSPAAPLAPEGEGRILFQDSFENGLANWNQFVTRTGAFNGTMVSNSPDIRLVRCTRDERTITAAELIGRAPTGPRVGIATKPLDLTAEAFVLAYEYTYEGRLRRAMEGLEVGALNDAPLFRNGAFTQPALPPGQWNKVQWECERRTDAQGAQTITASLIFNGERLGSAEYPPPPGGIGLELTVIEGQFRFANVAIREMKKERTVTSGR